MQYQKPKGAEGSCSVSYEGYCCQDFSGVRGKIRREGSSAQHTHFRIKIHNTAQLILKDKIFKLIRYKKDEKGMHAVSFMNFWFRASVCGISI